MTLDEGNRWPDPIEVVTGEPLRDNEGIYDAMLEAATPDRIGILKNLGDYLSRKMQWLWEGIIPIGAAVIFAGQGGVSKSTFSIALAGKVTKGTLPGIALGMPSDVIYVSHEDGIEDVVLPRAQVNDVDVSKFHIFGVATKIVNGVSMPKFPEDLAILEEKIKEVNARVVIVDPILSAMASGRDPNSNVDVRELIDPLNQLAQRMQITVICIAHINKTVTSARTAVTGSAAWSDATRGTLLFAMEEPDPQMQYSEVVFGATKGNYGRGGANYTYRVWDHEHTHDSGEVGGIPLIEFLGTSNRSVGEVLAGQSEDGRVGNLSKDVVEYVNSLTGAVTTAQITQEFSEHSRQAVQNTIGRLARAGRIDKVTHGTYQSIRLRT